MEETINTTAVAVPAELVTEVTVRANEVANQLLALKGNMEANFLDMCDLLAEAQDNNYHTQYGFTSFVNWVEVGSGLDISPRQAFYYTNISRVTKKLNVPKDKLLQIGISKLKEIFSLPAVDKTDEIKGLLDEAPNATIDEIKQKVRGMKNPADASKKFITLKLEEGVKDTFDKAIELARMNYGSTVSDGEVVDISISKALELICVDYLQDPNNYPEGESPATFAPDMKSS